ncbi:hypothetical protein ASF43_09035 [Pseudorhodoferax sp. Leaf267]|nr:hypothetical protein ASF43_09035 [Pseudorhodoferax sp. Leaf267]
MALASGPWSVSMAQTSPAAAAAAAGTSTTANGGTGGVGLGGSGPAVGVRPDGVGGAGNFELGKPTGNGALVGPRARREADALLSEKPALQEQAPRNTGQRTLMLDREQRPAAMPQPAK